MVRTQRQPKQRLQDIKTGLGSSFSTVLCQTKWVGIKNVTENLFRHTIEKKRAAVIATRDYALRIEADWRRL